MCVTCSIAAGETIPPGGIIYQDGLIVVNHSMDVDIPGYIMVSPVRHVEHYHEMTAAELAAVGTVMKRLVAVLYQWTDVEKVYMLSLGEDTRHFHFHVFPRYGWMLEQSDAFIDGKVDGAELFSQIRQRYSLLDCSSSGGMDEAARRIRSQLQNGEMAAI